LHLFKGDRRYIKTTYNNATGEWETILLNFDEDASLYDFDSVSLTPNKQDDSRLQELAMNLLDYINWNFLALFFSCSLLFQLILKILFNMCSKYNVAIDKWALLDTICAVLNIVAVSIVSNISPYLILNDTQKDYLDYFMILVQIVSWFRFFIYFLVVRSISKMLLTLIEMIGDTFSFLFIVACYLSIMASIFTTLYQDDNYNSYGSIARSFRTLYDACLTNYNHKDMG